MSVRTLTRNRCETQVERMSSPPETTALSSLSPTYVRAIQSSGSYDAGRARRRRGAGRAAPPRYRSASYREQREAERDPPALRPQQRPEPAKTSRSVMPGASSTSRASSASGRSDATIRRQTDAGVRPAGVPGRADPDRGPPVPSCTLGTISSYGCGSTVATATPTATPGLEAAAPAPRPGVVGGGHPGRLECGEDP